MQSLSTGSECIHGRESKVEFPVYNIYAHRDAEDRDRDTVGESMTPGLGHLF